MCLLKVPSISKYPYVKVSAILRFDNIGSDGGNPLNWKKLVSKRGETRFSRYRVELSKARSDLGQELVVGRQQPDTLWAGEESGEHRASELDPFRVPLERA